MARLRIYDLKEHILFPDLKDLLRLLAPGSLQATWTISTVKSSEPGHEWFEATGEGRDELETLAQENARISGADFAALAEKTHQIIWGEFIGSKPTQPEELWVIIRAIDSTFYEIETDDDALLKKISAHYKDVRTDDAPVS